jgi:hypothetical protein
MSIVMVVGRGHPISEAVFFCHLQGWKNPHAGTVRGNAQARSVLGITRD